MHVIIFYYRILYILSRLRPIFFKIFILVSVFLILSFFNFWANISWWLHVTFLLFYLAMFFLTFIFSKDLHLWPSKKKIAYIIEKNSKAEANPISALIDIPYLTSRSDSIWELHQINMKKNLKNLKLNLRTSNYFSKIDPLIIRLPITIFLLVSFFYAESKDSIAGRIRDAFIIDYNIETKTLASVEAWIKPPDYTKKENKYLSKDQYLLSDRAIFEKVPKGSELIIKILSKTDVNVIVNDKILDLIRLDDFNYSSEININENKNIIVEQKEKKLFKWSLSIIEDSPPKVSFVSEPFVTKRKAIKMDYQATDDYGIKRILVRLYKPKEFSSLVEEYVELEVIAPKNFNNKEINGVKYLNLVDHIWSGYKTTFSMQGEDFIGQKDFMEKEIMIPEKDFYNPTAKKIISFRKNIALNKLSIKKLYSSLDIIKSEVKGSDLTKSTEKIFNYIYEDINKIKNKNIDSGDILFMKLWELAILIENNNLSNSEVALRKSEEELSKSIVEKNNLEGVNDMLASLNENISDYLDKIEDSFFPKDDANTENRDAYDNNKRDSIESLKNNLDYLMQDISDLASIGANKEAEKTLEKLRDITENIVPEDYNPKISSQSDSKQDILEQLSKLIDKQEIIMEESFHEASKQGYAEQNSPGNGKKSTPEKQDSLKQSLAQMMRDIGKKENQIPSELGRAERAMRQALKELEKGNLDKASNAQGRAMELMKRGAKEFSKKSSKDSQSNLEKANNENNFNPNNTDPLGRPLEKEGNLSGADIGISKKREILKAKKIASELYKRSSEESRSKEEKAYIGRLLDWY